MMIGLALLPARGPTGSGELATEEGGGNITMNITSQIAGDASGGSEVLLQGDPPDQSVGCQRWGPCQQWLTFE